jgi:zinc protease
MQKVYKHILKNGLTILAVSQKTIPKVSTQLWYNVGSKDETDGEKGIAHLIEHMIFKGTNKLSECDINLITHKLSGYCNAFTSYDYTGYLFDFPSQNWHESLILLADCMRNCTFKEEFLNSELKAVIQEIKMYKDDYATTLIENMLSAIFPDHPYHYPIIGYKQDLWNLSREKLLQFYQQHYIPNNATLVVVGDVDPESVFTKSEQAFGEIFPDLNYRKKEFYHSSDLRSTATVLYRDIQQPLILVAWVVPGSKIGRDYIIDIFTWIIGSGKGSRLYRKLVDDLQLLTELEAFNFDLTEHGVFFIRLQPKNLEDLDTILGIIYAELEELHKHGPTEQELDRAIKKTEVDYLSLLENIQKQAYNIGKSYLATGNEQFLYSYTDYPRSNIAQEIKDLVGSYLRSSVAHHGKVLPMASSDKTYWSLVQNVSDYEDTRILSGRNRTAQVEEGKCVNSIKLQPPKPFSFPKAQIFELSNGLKVFYYNNPLLPKVDLILDFKAKYNYDPAQLQGLGSFVLDMLVEGTENYSASDFAGILEEHGMSFIPNKGQIAMSMLSTDLKLGLELLAESVSKAVFNNDAIEKVRAQIISYIKQYWDNPSDFSSQLMREIVYKDHPNSQSSMGTLQSVNYITKEDLLAFYKKYISPRGSRIAIVGDLQRHNLPELFEKIFANWDGPVVEDIIFPELKPVTEQTIDYPIARDQVVLGYAGLSVKRTDPDYDKLLLFDQVFSGGVLGSMSSRLFDLREQTGLFYTISGSLVAKVTQEPGMIVVKTLISNDRLAEAEKALEQLIDKGAKTLTQEELVDAKNGIINSLVDYFASNMQIAQVFLSQDTYKFESDYFDMRAIKLDTITIKDIQEAVGRWLSSKKLAKLRVGRVI